MYNTKFVCRYYKDEVFLDTYDVTDEEREYIRDVLYKEDLLIIFNIDFDDYFDVFDEIIAELHGQIKDCLPLKECMQKMAATFMSEDEETGLVIMYSYDYMYVTHKCVSEYLETGSISDENIELLDKITK